jgi:hypothetical protein
LALSLILIAFLGVAPMASAGQPAAIDRGIQVQNRHTTLLLFIDGVVGTAASLDAAGGPVMLVFLKQNGFHGIPANLDGVPVVTEVTGDFSQPCRI